jgi:dTDP-4-dehydrorhamnose 3,5-epimerase-like enzyme
MKLENCYLIDLPEIPDGIDGKLSVAEGLHNIPFEIKRVYFIYGLENPDAVRGKHAHKQLEQVIFCLHGSFLLGVDDGHRQEELLISHRNTGVFLGTGLWHTMTRFSKDCVLLVLASDYYQESDYIRDYEEFKRYCLGKQYDPSK